MARSFDKLNPDCDHSIKLILHEEDTLRPVSTDSRWQPLCSVPRGIYAGSSLRKMRPRCRSMTMKASASVHSIRRPGV